MDADAHFDLVLVEVESGLAGRRDSAGGQGHTKRAATVINALSKLEQGVEIALVLGSCAEDFLGQHRQADPTTPSGVQGALYGNIVGDHNGLDAGASLHRSHLGSHIEVHDVTGVVLNDVEYANPTIDGLGGLGDLVGDGGGEDLAAACGVEHPPSDVARVQRLVSGTATRDQTNLSVHRTTGAQHYAMVEIDFQAVWVGGRYAAQGINDDILDSVDEFLHGTSEPS